MPDALIYSDISFANLYFSILANLVFWGVGSLHQELRPFRETKSEISLES